MKKGFLNFSVSLLALSCSGMGCVKNLSAQEVIDADKLNSLTGPKVTWTTSTADDPKAIFINGEYYKYQYINSDNYDIADSWPSRWDDGMNKLYSGLNVSQTLLGESFLNNDFVGNSSEKIIIGSVLGNISGVFVDNTMERLNHDSFIYSVYGGSISDLIAVGNHGGTVLVGAADDSTIYSGTIQNSIFIGNSSTAYAGAFFNHEGKTKLINSSFYNNYAQTTGNGSTAAGGAIYNVGDNYNEMKGILNITADNGESIFSGNKVIYKDASGNDIEESNAIYSDGGTINLNSINGGTIRFDDSIIGVNGAQINIMSQEKIKEYGEVSYFSSAEELASQYQINADDLKNLSIGDKYEFGDICDACQIHSVYKEDDRYTVFTKDVINTGENDDGIYELLNRGWVIKNGDRYVISDIMLEMIGRGRGGEFYIQDGQVYSASGPVNYITYNDIEGGDVIINAPIIGFSELTQDGANVYFTANSPINYNYFLNFGNLYDATIKSGGKLYVGGVNFEAVANNTTVSDGGIMDVLDGGTANDTAINDGGSMFVKGGSTANNTTVNSGGELHAENQAKLQGLLAKGGALIDLDAGTILTGEVIISTDANLDTSRGFDYSQIFKNDEESSSGTLTLEGGNDNPLLENVSSLTNTSENKNLVLSNGDYDIGTGAKALSGWKELNVVNDSTVKVVGDTTEHKSYIQFGNLNLSKGSTLDLAGSSPLYATIDGSVNNDGHFNFNHATDSADDITTIKGNYKALANAEMTIDVDPITNIADKLVIEGDVSGRTKVTINPLSADKSTGKALFVEAPNDDTSTGAYFDVYRVIGDAHKWNSLYDNNKWYVATDNVISESSPSGYGTLDDGTGTGTGSDSKPNKVTNLYSEALAYFSLPKAGLEQLKDLFRTISNKVSSSKVKSGYCGMSECAYNGRPLNGVWIDLGNKQSDIEAPAEIESKIKSVDLGFDVQSDLHNRLGIFASYRQGEYELSGKGEDYYSEVGSDIDIDSWTIGLYHRYDYGRLWTTSAIYGGLQKIDINTNDGISTDTKGLQFGGSIEAGLVFEPKKRLTIEPSVRLGYNFIKFDKMSDRYGKTAKYDNVHNVEVEAGVKVEKTFFHNRHNAISKIYVKPSIIQNFGKGDVNITSLDTIEGVENETLLRGEIGTSFNFGNGWSGYGAIGYTFGSDYHSTDYNLGIRYNW